ncbi:MAG: hypothetical protein E7330_05195 [Clostridiales bacterium]|nr:hypothetical protein [Clostridiales bacterium]
MLLTVLLFIIGAAAVLLLNGSQGETLEVAAMETKIAAKGIIIRDEMSVTVDRYDRVAFSAAEGAAAYEGMPVASVFKWGYSDDMLQSLISVETDIYAAQKALLQGVENADLANIELQIEQKRDAIRNFSTDGEGDLLQLENDLKTLLTQRKTYLRSAVQPTEALNSLYASEAEKQAQLASYMTEVSASGTGVISFYFDGYEQALNYDKLDMLNPELIERVIKNTANMAGGTAENLLYRLVNPNLWHIAFLTGKNDPLRIMPGSQYTVSVSSAPGRTYTGTAVSAEVYDGGVVNLLVFSEDIGPLLSARTAEITLTAPAGGLSISAEALKMKDGVAHVVVRTDGEEREIPVDVLAVTDGIALIQTKDPADPVAAGMRYVKP